MRKLKKAGVLLAAGVLSAAMLAVPAGAEDFNVDGHCEFNGTEITSDFDTGVLVKEIANLQPGDRVSFSVEYKNAYSESTEWYMENEILQTLEKTAAAKKVAGLGTASGGGYIYELIHIDKNGNSEILFGADPAGQQTAIGGADASGSGSSSYGGRVGLEQGTNATEEWFWIETLKQGESGRIVLNVSFDGETEVNDYMDTDGGLAVRFSVELTPKNGPPANPSTTPGAGKKTTGVNTGDPTQIGVFVAILAAGVAMMIIVLVRKKRQTDGKDGEQ